MHYGDPYHATRNQLVIGMYIHEDLCGKPGDVDLEITSILLAELVDPNTLSYLLRSPAVLLDYPEIKNVKTETWYVVTMATNVCEGEMIRIKSVEETPDGDEHDWKRLH